MNSTQFGLAEGERRSQSAKQVHIDLVSAASVDEIEQVAIVLGVVRLDADHVDPQCDHAVQVLLDEFGIVVASLYPTGPIVRMVHPRHVEWPVVDTDWIPFLSSNIEVISLDRQELVLVRCVRIEHCDLMLDSVDDAVVDEQFGGDVQCLGNRGGQQLSASAMWPWPVSLPPVPWSHAKSSVPCSSVTVMRVVERSGVCASIDDGCPELDCLAGPIGKMFGTRFLEEQAQTQSKG